MQGLGSGLGAYFGDQMSRGDLDKILQYLQAQYDDTSKLDPSQLGKTAFDSADPATRAAQMKALNQLAGISDAQGLDPMARAANAASERQAAGYEQSQRGAINQDMQARGMGGSGAEMASLLQAQQSGANRVATADQQNAATAQQRQMAAIEGAGQLAGGIRGQDYQKAGAEDSAKEKAWKAALDRLAAMGHARGDMANFYAADRANTIGTQQALAGGIWGGLGGIGDAAIGGVTGGASKGLSANDGSGSSGMAPVSPMPNYSQGYPTVSYPAENPVAPVSTDPSRKKTNDTGWGY